MKNKKDELKNRIKILGKIKIVNNKKSEIKKINHNLNKKNKKELKDKNKKKRNFQDYILEEEDEISIEESENYYGKKQETKRIIKTGKNYGKIKRSKNKKFFKYLDINKFYYKNIIIDKNSHITIQKLIILSLLLILSINLYNNNYNTDNNHLKNYKIINSINKTKKLNLDYNNNNFAIIQKHCAICGLFSFYIYFLGCVNNYILEGYIPIVDLKTYPNMYNNFSSNISYNPWEFLFEQPYGYTLEEVLKNVNKLKYFECGENYKRPGETNVYYNKILINFWHDIAFKYIPIKKEIINESDDIIKKLFQGSNNILGVMIRGTDYISKKPYGHPKPPDLNTSFSDVKKMDEKYRYDWIFFSSEDETIKEKFKNEFKDKIKYFDPMTKINYNYKKKDFLSNNLNIRGNMEYAKTYLINIYILSKCNDIIMCRTSGAAGLIILTNGFRNSLIYNIGYY